MVGTTAMDFNSLTTKNHFCWWGKIHTKWNTFLAKEIVKDSVDQVSLSLHKMAGDLRGYRPFSRQIVVVYLTKGLSRRKWGSVFIFDSLLQKPPKNMTFLLRSQIYLDHLCFYFIMLGNGKGKGRGYGVYFFFLLLLLFSLLLFTTPNFYSNDIWLISIWGKVSLFSTLEVCKVSLHFW